MRSSAELYLRTPGIPVRRRVALQLRAWQRGLHLFGKSARRQK